MTPDGTAGCPSGLEPASATLAADPSAFIRSGAEGRDRLELLVRGAKCGGCLNKIEKGLAALPGVELARLNLSTGRLAVEWRTGTLDPVSIPRTLDQLGYGSAPFDPKTEADEAREEERFLLKCLAVAGFAAANVMLLSVSVWAGAGDMNAVTRDVFHWISALIAIPAVAYSGRPFFRSARKALAARQVNMDVPISLGVLLATGMSLVETARGGHEAYFDAAVMLLFFLLIGRYLDQKLRGRARRAARDLLAMQAAGVTLRRADGTLAAAQARDVRPGDTLLIATGERFAVDVDVAEGRSEIDAAMVTGETDPVIVGPGQRIYSGSINLSAPLIVTVAARAEDSLLAEIARLMEAGEQGRSAFRRLADKAAALYVPVVHTLAASTFIGWLLIFAAITLLIITCPCALGLAAPVVQIVAVGRLFSRGILVKSGDALERLAHTDTVVLDKTGTLTLGKPSLVGAVAPDALALAAMLARASRHPLSRALVAAAGSGPVAAGVEEISGAGLIGRIDGVEVRLGSARHVGVAAVNPISHDGPMLWLRQGDAAPVPFLFADALRPDALASIAALKQRGYSIELLSGDRKSVVAAAAKAAGTDGWAAEVDPVEKAARLDSLKAQGRQVLMVGDGLNDAAALARAHASISPGSAVDASQAASDMVFQGGSLGALVDAVDVARLARRRMLENFSLAAVYNVFAIPIAVFGFVTPLIAAAAMSGSSIIVISNALRLNGGKIGLDRKGTPPAGRRSRSPVPSRRTHPEPAQ
jgi:P-type Cu2+ transporter